MTNFPSDPYSYGTAHYRPVIDSLQLRTPVPRPQIVGDWLHIAYGSVNIFETDGGITHTSWQLRIVMPTAADYTAMVAYIGSFQTLTSDFGSHTALLRALEGAQQQSQGWWQAQATFEWSS